MTRQAALERLARRILSLPADHTMRVAIDGIDAAGKTTLADELVGPLQAGGRPVIRATVDGFHRPRAERYRQGPNSPTGYYEDSFQYATVRDSLLLPLGPGGSRLYRRAVFDLEADAHLAPACERAPERAILLFDGIFLLRPELDDLWDYRIFVEVTFEVALRRALVRDRCRLGTAMDVEARYLHRYFPAQRHYLQTVRPRERADVVVENDDPGKPVLHWIVPNSPSLAPTVVHNEGKGEAMASATARFDIKTAPQFVSYEDMLRVWREADEIPSIGGAWVFDHFMPLGPDQSGPILEGWTLLAAFAAQTRRLRLGVMVTGNTYRHPAVLANMGATVDVISGGRLDFGIGAGWFEYEHTAYGIPLYSPGERIRRLGEACEVIRLLWTERTPDFEGRYYHLQHAYCEPKPVQRPYPPFVIGGGGERLTLRMVARYADMWNLAGGDVATFQHKNQVLDGHCAAIGRDPSTIVRSVQLVLDTENPRATRDEARAFVEAGARHVVIGLRPPYPERVVRRVAEEIVEPLQAELSAP